MFVPFLSFSLPFGLFFLQNLHTHQPIRATTTSTTTAKMAKIILKIETALVRRSGYILKCLVFATVDL